MTALVTMSKIQNGRHTKLNNSINLELHMIMGPKWYVDPCFKAKQSIGAVEILVVSLVVKKNTKNVSKSKMAAVRNFAI